jgi:hypothetical protein
MAVKMARIIYTNFCIIIFMKNETVVIVMANVLGGGRSTTCWLGLTEWAMF